MATIDIFMPQMGESITEGTLTKWHKKLGDKVAREEILFEISTDKVDTEIPSPVAGTLTKILFEEGAVVAVNAIVAVVDDSGSASVVVPAVTPPAVAKPTSVAPSLGTIQNQPAEIVTVDDSKDDRNDRILSSPLVRKMAAEQNIDLSKVTGTGDSGRITKTDLMSFVSSGLVASASRAAAEPAKIATSVQMASTGGSAVGVVDGTRIERVPMTTMRKKIAEHMVMSKHTSPHVTSVIEIDVQNIVNIRAKSKDKFEAAHGVKLSFMPFFMHAALQGLRAVPILNSSIESDVILYKKDVNLGVAVALDWGLIVPVIKSAGDKNFVGLAKDLTSLADKARLKKLAPDDVRGGSFSISNYGGFGTIIGQPIINQPQVAIMGIGAMTKKPVVINDAIAVRTMVYVVLSFDHRIIDGSDSGKFLSIVKETLEGWTLPVV